MEQARQQDETVALLCREYHWRINDVLDLTWTQVTGVMEATGRLDQKADRRPQPDVDTGLQKTKEKDGGEAYQDELAARMKAAVKDGKLDLNSLFKSTKGLRKN